MRRRDTTLAEFVSSLARLPLAHEPGEVHEYGWSAEVLSRVVEVASGQPFDQFLESRIFGPLHMVDTGFFVPKEKLDRLVDSPMPERPPIWDVTTPPKLFSGDGGLVSTAPDYLRFCQMLLNGGELDGVRVLSPHAVKQMTTNALPSGVTIFGGDEVGARAGTTFGLGFAIRADPVQSWIPGAVGSFSWAGHWSTYFWIDPAEQLIGVQMVQATPGSKGRQAVLYSGINHLVYGALTIPESTAVPPAAPVTLSPEALADYAGTYDFGATVSSRDRQGLADGKTGWLGIGNFVAMEQEGLRINKPNPGGGPATKAGVTAGDLITEIDGAPLRGPRARRCPGQAARASQLDDQDEARPQGARRRERPQCRESRPPCQFGPASGSRRGRQARRGSDGGLAGPRIREGQGDPVRGDIKPTNSPQPTKIVPGSLSSGTPRAKSLGSS